MKFTPRRITEEVNISREHPLREFFVLTGGILGTVLIAYLALGFAVDVVVPRIDPSLEKRLGDFMIPSLTATTSSSIASQKLQVLLDDLVELMDEPERNYRVHLVPEPEANAFALPGGHIVVLAGLVREAESENELAMILGHELGHFSHRDHLRGLGRGLVLVFLSSLAFGADSSISRLTGSLLGGAEMKFSQRQELQADAQGLELLVRKYGHAGGAVDFFKRLTGKQKETELKYLFATHPFPEARVRALEEKIYAEGHAVGQVHPLEEAFRDDAIFRGKEKDRQPG